MKFKSEIVTQASGSIGGVTYSHNRGGMYRRARAIPTNPSSAAQVLVRQTFSELATSWRDVLTAAQRLAWTNYAANSPVTDRFGDPLLLTGQQMYIRCNSVRIRAGATRVDDGPTVYGLISLSVVTIIPVITTGALVIVFSNTDAWANDDDGGLVLQTSRFVSPAINFLRSPMRYLATINGDSVTPPTSPDTSHSANAFGQDVASAAVGQKLFARSVAFAGDGRISPVVLTNFATAP